jgi:hypothetical protein
MQLNFLPDQNYDCVRCGYGWRHDWNVRVDQQRVENIRANYNPHQSHRGCPARVHRQRWRHHSGQNS